MAKKDFANEINTGFAKFSTEAQRQKAATGKKNECGRMNILFGDELTNFIDELHWRLRLSRNDVVVAIVRAYKEAYEKDQQGAEEALTKE